jgi:hypothetical protein
MINQSGSHGWCALNPTRLIEVIDVIEVGDPHAPKHVQDTLTC